MRKMMILASVALIAPAAPGISKPPSVGRQIAPADDQQAVNPTAGGGAPTNAASVQEKKLCRHLPSSYSRLPNRACLTAREWRILEDDLSH